MSKDKYPTGQYVFLGTNEENPEPNYKRIGIVKWHRKTGILLERGKGLDNIVVQEDKIEQRISKEEAEQMLSHDLEAYHSKKTKADYEVKEISMNLREAMDKQSNYSDIINGSKFTFAWLQQDETIAK